MKTIEGRFLDHVHDEQTFHNGHDTFIRYIDMLSSIVTECIYVIDVATNRFCYVPSNDLFLCGYSVEEALTGANDFYKKIVLKDDLPAWEKMYKAVLWYLKDSDEKRDEIDYFSSTFRLQRKVSFSSPRPLLQMIYHRMEPVWENGELLYIICSVRSAATKKTGNLRVYFKDGLTYEEYNITTRRWKWKTLELLTEREKAILILAQQGKNSEEIANYLCKSRNTIRNQIKPLFYKLNVHSIREAVDFAFYHHIIYTRTDKQLQSREAPHKRPRVILTADMMQHIQQYLDEGISIRQSARIEGIAESAIRYWINKRKLTLIKKPGHFCVNE